MASEDTRCPSCGEPIGARASWCMHCGVEFDSDGQRADAGAPGESGDAGDGGTVTIESDTPEIADGEFTETVEADTDFIGSGDRESTASSGLGAESLGEETRSPRLGVVAGSLIGIVAVMTLQSSLGLTGVVFGACFWLGSVVLLAWQRRLAAILHYGAYLLTALLIVYPFTFALVPSGGVGSVFFVGLPTWTVALGIGALGRRAAKRNVAQKRSE